MLNQPILSESQDALDAAVHIRGLSDYVKSDSGYGAMIAIVGAWGSGKTSLANMLSHKLIADADQRCVAVHVSLLPSDSIIELLYQLFKRLRVGLHDRGFGDCIDVAFWLLKQRIASVMKVSLGVTGSPLRMDVHGLGVRKLLYLNETMSLLRRAIERSMMRGMHRLVVFIDNLDRVKQESIDEIMEVCRTIATETGATFVMCYDYNVIVAQRENAALPSYTAPRLERYMDYSVHLEPDADIKLTEYFVARCRALVADCNADELLKLGAHLPL